MGRKLECFFKRNDESDNSYYVINAKGDDFWGKLIFDESKHAS